MIYSINIHCSTVYNACICPAGADKSALYVCDCIWVYNINYYGPLHIITIYFRLVTELDDALSVNDIYVTGFAIREGSKDLPYT